MKSKLIFIIPIFALLGFLAIKPPAVGQQKEEVIVTPEATITSVPKPHIRDFDDEGGEPRHHEESGINEDEEYEYDEDDEEGEHHEDHGSHHDDDDDESDEDDDD